MCDISVFSCRRFTAWHRNKYSLFSFDHLDIVNHKFIVHGIGKDGGSFAENYQFASLAIEMSLSRGGDQAVIKDRFNFTFYGSRVKETDRRTRIRSRLIASSLSELISQEPLTPDMRSGGNSRRS